MLAPPGWLRRQSGADVDARRNLVLACVFGAAFLLATTGLVVVANGRTIRPFILQAQGDGSVVPAGARLLPYRPGAPERRYFLAQWVRHLLALDARLSEAWLAEAWQLTRGKATVEFTDWLHATAPLQHLKDDPSLTRSVEILGISLVDDDVALVRVACEERSLGRPNAQRRKRLLTIHFQTSAPDSEDAALRNPIGLLVTDFQVGEDLER
ncbi:MAG: type IV secretion system protein [Pseudomonadota bacterium]|nr:type IV secretion system protein [Pseudomonadota bacterium]